MKNSGGIVLGKRLYVLGGVCVCVCLYLILIFWFISLFLTSVLVLCRHGLQECSLVSQYLTAASERDTASSIQFNSILSRRISLSGSLVGENIR